MGDFVLTLPALRLLRENLPGNHVEVLGYPSIAALAPHFGLAEAVRPLEHGALARFFVPGETLDEAWVAYFASFSVVVSHLFDPDGFFHANLARAGVHTLLRGPHRPAESGVPAARQLAQPLEALALFADDSVFRPLRTPEPATGAPPLVALHPGSGSPRKNWGLENWAAVATGLVARGARLAIVSGEAEQEVIAAFEGMLGAAGVAAEAWKNLPLTELAGRFAHASLFLGHDSGPSHLAAACGVRSVVLFGPSDPAVWAPQGSHVTVLRGAAGSLAALDPAAVLQAASVIS